MTAPTPDVLALLAATLDAVVIMDDRGRITAFNASAEEMFGYRAADALGRNVSMLMTSTDRAVHDDRLKRYLAGGEPRCGGPRDRCEGRDAELIRADGAAGNQHCHGLVHGHRGGHERAHRKRWFAGTASARIS